MDIHPFRNLTENSLIRGAPEVYIPMLRKRVTKKDGVEKTNSEKLDDPVRYSGMPGVAIARARIINRRFCGYSVN